MMSAQRRILMLLAAVCLAPAPLIAQSTGALPGANTRDFDLNRLIQNNRVLVGQVTTLRGDPISGAKVDVEFLSGSSGFRSLITDLQGRFQTELGFNADSAKEFSVALTVTKKGFLNAHETIDYGDPSKSLIITVTLREQAEDPRLLSQADLISRLGPRLKKLGASEGLSAAEEKDYARGVEEFLGQSRPDRALPPFTKVTRHDPSCLQCRTMLALAQLASGDWDGAYRNLAQAITKSWRTEAWDAPSLCWFTE